MVLSKNYNKGINFFIRYFVIILVLSFLFTSYYTKGECFILLNPVHTKALDDFFIYYTFLGNGLFALILFIILVAARQLLFSVQLLVAFLFSGILSQVFKQLIPAPRPMAFFEPGVYPGFIEGITHSGINSFPSGHTTTAFAMATMLALYTGNRVLIALYLLLAIGVGYSRVYLGQHFIEDIIAGAIIGVASGIFVHKWLKKFEIQWRIQGKPVVIRIS